MNYMAKGQQDYNEFCKLFDGKSWDDVDNIVKTNNLSYGAEKPIDGNGLADINYKNILATCRNENGVAKVLLPIEIYDDEGYVTITTMDDWKEHARKVLSDASDDTSKIEDFITFCWQNERPDEVNIEEFTNY